jgi:hypothetical protein
MLALALEGKIKVMTDRESEGRPPKRPLCNV